MRYSRRDFAKMTLAAAAGGTSGARFVAAARPNSAFGGVHIGIITYSFRALPSSAEEVLRYCLECGIDGVELMSNAAESYAGAPAQGRGGPGGGGGGRGQGRGRGQASPEQQEAMRRSAEEMKQWRLSVSMDKYKALRKMYNDAGVRIYAFKLPPTMAMSDDEYAYIWSVAETLGADHTTMELPTDDALLQRVADYAAKRKLRIAFHTHGQGGSSGFDRALGASKYTALNLDVGHYYGVNGQSPVTVIEKYNDRIASLHLKDRKGPAAGGEGARAGGPNMPWGQGETPLREVLQTMKKNHYRFPASIEYEYETPAGSDVLAEIKKCVQFCRAALA